MEKLREWRKSQGMTLAAAGALIDVSAVTWLRYETGDRKPAPQKIGQLSAMTGIPREYLRPDIFAEVQ